MPLVKPSAVKEVKLVETEREKITLVLVSLGGGEFRLLSKQVWENLSCKGEIVRRVTTDVEAVVRVFGKDEMVVGIQGELSRGLFVVRGVMKDQGFPGTVSRACIAVAVVVPIAGRVVHLVSVSGKSPVPVNVFVVTGEALVAVRLGSL